VETRLGCNLYEWRKVIKAAAKRYLTRFVNPAGYAEMVAAVFTTAASAATPPVTLAAPTWRFNAAFLATPETQPSAFPPPPPPRQVQQPPTPLSPAAAGLEADDFLLHFDSAPDFIAYLDDIETAAADFSPLRDAGF